MAQRFEGQGSLRRNGTVGGRRVKGHIPCRFLPPFKRRTVGVVSEGDHLSVVVDRCEL